LQSIANSFGARKGRLVPILLMAFMMILAASATLVFYSKFRGSYDGDTPEQTALKYLAEFRPEEVDKLGPEVLKRPELSEVVRRRDQIATFKQQLMDYIEAKNPFIWRLTIGSQSARNVTLQRARADSVTFVIGQQLPDNAPWSRFGPTGVHEMAKEWKLLNSAVNRYAMALYALSANTKGLARDLFNGLQGTQFAGPAAEYLRQLDLEK